MIKFLNEKGKKQLDLINQIQRHKKIHIFIGKLVYLYHYIKKECSNYRDTILASTVGNLYARILEGILRKYIES